MSILNEIRENLLKDIKEFIPFSKENPEAFLIIATSWKFIDNIQEGFFEEALEILEGAYPEGEGTGNPLDLLFLGQMYLLIGQEDKALMYFEESSASAIGFMTEDLIKKVMVEIDIKEAYTQFCKIRVESKLLCHEYPELKMFDLDKLEERERTLEQLILNNPKDFRLKTDYNITFSMVQREALKWIPLSIINSNYLNHLYNLVTEKKVMNFKSPSRFALFFSSSKDIENKIVLDNYKESFNCFVKSFESQNCSNKEKKEALEYLVFCIFDLLPEFKVIGKDVITEAEEIDLIITINSPLFDIFEILGSNFIIECRNLKEKVDAKQIRDFGIKILDKNLKGGVIISREGITGRTQLEGARLAIRDFANKGVTILVMNKSDLNEISKGRNPLDVIKRSYTNLYFKGLNS